MGLVAHRARRPKNNSPYELAELGVQLLQVNRRRRSRLGTEHAGCAFEQLVLPVNDLIGVEVVQLGSLGQRLLASDGVNGHLGLEDR